MEDQSLCPVTMNVLGRPADSSPDLRHAIPAHPPQLLTLNVLSQTNSCVKPLSLGWLHVEQRLPGAFLSRLQWSPGWAGEEAG